ncbi:rod shape-determining protein MreC [Exiguobacterium flavidum]|uniref:rod shape-determining protein MreC n=1 Tax=Exiguobacterium flavidum TaxID=2184695 RepID=UPI000DF74FB3|nr:rod shape-determining protein MreC [Exiguobacterium flavidum]
MKRFLNNRKLLITLLSFLLLVILIGVTLQGRNQSHWYQSFARDTAGVGQRLFATPIGWVDDTVTSIKEVRDVYKENEYLKSRLNDYADTAVEVRDLKRENEELKDMIGLDGSIRDYTLLPAEMIGRNPSEWHRYVTVNIGKEQGVKADMAVITADGLIGRVIQTSAYTSLVQLLSDTSRTNNVSAVADDTRGKGVFGTIEGFDEERKLLKFTKIPNDAKLKRGQSVTTSGLGGKYPSGIVIGKIEKLESDKYGASKIAYVKPAADFDQFGHVFVIEREAKEPFAESVTGGDTSE